MTWVFVGAFVGLTVVVAIGVRRDIRRAVERRRAREFQRRLNRLMTEAIGPMADAFEQVQVAAVKAGAAFQQVGEALREVGVRSPFPPHPKQKGSTR